MPTDSSGPIWNKRLRVVDFSHAKSDSPVDRMKNTVNRELTEMKFRNQWFSDFTNSWINTKFLIFKGFIEHHFCVESNVSKWCSLSNMAHKNEDNTLSTLPCNFMRFLVTKKAPPRMKIEKFCCDITQKSVNFQDSKLS